MSFCISRETFPTYMLLTDSCIKEMGIQSVNMLLPNSSFFSPGCFFYTLVWV
uniref:Uncharacterized protein n=1 Tax=Arundo donax TaxID=35708 RepID=A0A0A9C7P7_ARUDO